jgi:hypothetical protein
MVLSFGRFWELEQLVMIKNSRCRLPLDTQPRPTVINHRVLLTKRERRSELAIVKDERWFDMVRRIDGLIA